MSITKRKNGQYTVRIDSDRTTNGARQRRTVGTFRTRTEAQRAEREALAAKDRGIDLSPKRVTVEALMLLFIEDRKTKDRAVRTVERYESLMKHWIFPKVGSLPLATLKPAHVSDLLANASNAGLAPKTQKHILNLLRTVLRWAMKLDLVARNVADSIDSPTVPRSNARSLSEEEVRRLLTEADKGRWGGFFRLALATGARRGELLALRWSDITVDEKSVSISRAFVESAKKGVGVLEKGTKTNRARRIPIGVIGTVALRRQRVMQAEDKLKAGGAFQDSGHVFQRPLGGSLSPYMATDGFRYIRDRLKLKATLHDLRHTAATWMLSSGIDIRSVAQVLGTPKRRRRSPSILMSCRGPRRRPLRPLTLA
jgi:integrase